MRKRIASILLLIALSAAIIGIALLLYSNFDIMKSVIGETDTVTRALANKLYFFTAALLVIWLVLFIFFVDLQRTGSIFGDRRKDKLTGIGGKKALRSCYKKASADSRKYVALAYIAFDVNKVKEKYDEKLCNTLQINAAKILRSACGKEDCSARIGDGIFAISLCCKDGLQAHERINEIIERLNKYQDKVLIESIAPYRAGIYLPEKHSILFDTALKNAQIGYKCACDGDVYTLICTKDLLVKEASKARLREEFSRAIDNNEFELHLQFLYEVGKKKFTGAEALSRWNNPSEGLLLPGRYINDMRSTGIIEKFDMYMLDKTCALLEKWGKTKDFKDIEISCNMTRITISSPDFTKAFKKIIGSYKFNHDKLILEITEDAFIDNKTVAYKNLVECKEEGIQIALDDFGAGHSSLNDLGDYPVDYIKIDRQIIVKSVSERGDALLSGIIKLAHNLGVEVVCEGIETKEQNDVAIKNGCERIQGYYYSYVYSTEEAEKYYMEKK